MPGEGFSDEEEGGPHEPEIAEGKLSAVLEERTATFDAVTGRRSHQPGLERGPSQLQVPANPPPRVEGQDRGAQDGRRLYRSSPATGRADRR